MLFDWLQSLSLSDYIWLLRNPPATENDISELQRFVGVPLPNDYISFLLYTNGADIQHHDYWMVHFWVVTL